MKNLKLLLVLSVVVLFPKSALAIKVQAPLTVDNGTITCSNGNCTTASGTLTSNAVLYGGGSKAISAATVNATATKMYLSQTSSGTPTFAQIAIGDLSASTSAALYGNISDETGSASGSPLAVFNQNPTINGVTGTGTWGLTGATVNLPSNAVDAIGEISATILASTANAAKLATIGATSLINGRCVQIDSDLNLVPAAGACGTSINSRIVASSQTPVTVLNSTPIYMSLGGAVSATEADVRTQIPSNATFGAMGCIAKAGTANAITATLGTAACTSAANYTSKLTQNLSTTANTVTADSGSTSVTGDDCAVIKLATASGDATQAEIICTLEITG